MLLSMVACSNDVFEDELIEKASGVQTRSTDAIVEAETSTLAYVLSEGVWTNNVMGSIAEYNPSTNAIKPNYFSTVNGVDLGDTGNEMLFYNGMIYCLVSGHDLTSNDGGLWMIDPKTCKATRSRMFQFEDPKMKKYYAMPRHMAFDKGILYISTYSGGVIAVSATDPSKVIGRKVLPAKFSEGICVVNDEVYVCNSGNEGDEMAGKGNTISYFSTKFMDGTSEGVSTMQTALNPKLIKYSPQNKLFYYNALGENAMNTSLHYFASVSERDYTVKDAKASDFDLTESHIYTVDVDWQSYKTKMFSVNLSDNVASPLTLPASPRFFGLSVKYHNGLLYVGESMGPRLFVLSESGSLVNQANTNVNNVNTIVFIN